MFETKKSNKSLEGDSNTDSELDSLGEVSSDEGHYNDLPIIIETNSEKYEEVHEEE